MKINAILFGLLIIFGCDQNYPTPDSTLVCEGTPTNHPKHSEYQDLLDTYTADGLVGISLLTDSPTDGIWTGGSGFAAIETNTAMTACHLHHTASIYKTFISVITLQLAEEGRLSLDDKVMDYLPAQILDPIPNGRVITIRQLLQHRTGLVDIFEVDFLMDFFNNPKQDYTMEELMTYMHDTKAESAPGTDFYYSDANFTLLSLLINELEGSYAESFRNRIFEPLGMTDTHFIDQPSEAPDGLANSYWDRFGHGKIENISDIQIATTAGLRGSDGIISSTNDLRLFIQAIADGTLLTPVSLAEMTTFIEGSKEQMEQHGITAYGLGLMRISFGTDYWYGHFGNHLGSAAMVLYNPDRDMTIVAFTNTGTFLSDDTRTKFFGYFLYELEQVMYE